MLSTPPTTPARPKATPRAPSKPRAKRARFDLLDHVHDERDEEMDTKITNSIALHNKFSDAIKKEPAEAEEQEPLPDDLVEKYF